MKLRTIVPALLALIAVSCGQKPQSPNNHIVTIKGMKFQPAELKINKYDTVTWVNNDFVDHDVIEQTGAWNSSVLSNGKQWSRVIDRSADYFCSIHVVMKGKLKVN